MQRFFTGLLVVTTLLSARLVSAQTLTPYGFADGGWIGEKSAFYCSANCTDMSSILFEVRRPSESYAQTNFGHLLSYYQGAMSAQELQGFVDGGLFLHVAPRFNDGGTGPFDPEMPLQVDLQCDQNVATPVVSGSPPEFQVSVPTLVDSQSGVGAHGFYIMMADNISERAYLANGPAPTVQVSFGEGSYQVCADGNDAVANYCSPSGCAPLNIVSSPLTAPAAPTPVARYHPFRNFDMTVPFQALAWHAQTLFNDGGIVAGPFARELFPSTQMRAYFPACAIDLRARVSALTDAGITPWSAWSTPFSIDADGPTPPGSLQVMNVGNGVWRYSWAASTDSCLGVGGYHSTTYTPTGGQSDRNTLGLMVDESFSTPGTYTVEVYAIDLANQESGRATTTFVIPFVDAGQPDAGFDAGFDAGLPDAGPGDSGFDAGLPDAGVDAGPFDAGFDAGPFDAGFDAGPADSGVDAGLPDASVDAGTFDAGDDAGFDAGTDAGPPDGGNDSGFDAGPTPVVDAGHDAGLANPPDAGPENSIRTVGCDCSSSGSGAFWLMLLIPLLRRKSAQSATR